MNTHAREGTNPHTGSIPCVEGKNYNFISQEKYFLWKSEMKNPSCGRKYSSCDAHSTPCNRRNISCHMMKYTHVTRKTFCDRKNTSCNKRSIISVTKRLFSVRERIFLVTGNTFPVKGRIKNMCHMKNISWQRIIIGLKNNCMNRTGAISKLIPWMCISDQHCHWFQLYVEYNLDYEVIFSRCFGQNYLLMN